MSKIDELIKNKAFYYIATNDNLELSERGDTLVPTIGGQTAKAFWIKNSPASVWLFEDVSPTKDKFRHFLKQALAAGATTSSVVHHARGAGGEEFAKEFSPN